MALEVTKPNIRKMFIPDLDHYIIEIDIKQGDAQVVAWEAQAKKLMDLFERQSRGELINGHPIDVHSQNALIVSPELPTDSKGRVADAVRQLYKKSVHATNYGVTPYSLAHKIGITIQQANVFQSRWFGANPEIPAWHRAIELELMTKRSVTNIFGYRKFFFDRIENCLPEALAWKPQSTVALTVNAGIRNVKRKIPFVNRLLQVHDSALYQAHKKQFSRTLCEDLIACHLITLPYPRPLTMGVDVKISDTSWGECEDMESFLARAA